jgi:hypothetical protein
MSIAFLYWLIMILWLLFSLWNGRRVAPNTPWNWQPLGGSVILWILLFIIGWRIFGFPLHP